MRVAVWFAGLAISVACSATTTTPGGTTLASWKYTDAPRVPADVAAAAAGATARASGKLEVASKHGATIQIVFETGTVTHGGKRYRVPLMATAGVLDPAGFAITGSFSDGPMHYAGMADDVRALDFRATLSSGTRSCAGTSYKNDTLRVRVSGDGTAKLLPDPVPVGSVAPPVL